MSEKIPIRFLLIALSALALIAVTSCDSSRSDKSSDESSASFTLGVSDPGSLSSLVWIAEDQEYFLQHGLKMNVKSYESGLAATKDLLAGKLDFALASEFVASRYILEHPDLRIITSLCESDDVKLVGRMDHGVAKISDVRHKRIGVLRGSVGEFYLDLLMVLHRVPFQEVEKVDLPPSELVKALSRGELDAAVLWEPFVTTAIKELEPNAFSCSAQSGQGYHWLLLGMEEAIRKRPQAVHSLVSTLVSVEDFAKNRRDDAKKTVARKLGLDDVDTLWKRTRFRVCIDHLLILKIEAQIRWMDPRFETQSEMPDLLNFMYFDALKSVQPDRIKILY